MPRKFHIVKEGVQPISRATVGSAGYDLRAADTVVIPSIFKGLTHLSDIPMTLEEAQLKIKELGLKATLVPTGIAVELDEGDYADLRSRSGVSSKNLLVMPNGMGLIDQDFYPNEIQVPLLNFSPFPVIINKGDKIAQLVIGSFLTLENEPTVEAERTSGFNSTGLK